MRCYKFQLKPSNKQNLKLLDNLETSRFLYNKLLEVMTKNNIKSKNELSKYLTWMKKQDDYKFLNNYYSKMLQPIIDRLYSNIKGLAISKKNGNKIGKLRFKGQRWFKTIMYNQSGFKLMDTKGHYNILSLSKIGDIKIRQHRNIEGNIKSIIIKRKVSSWEAHIITDAKYTLESGSKMLGIDMGVMSFLTTSENEHIDNPLFLNKSLSKVKDRHRKISMTKKRSKNRKKQCLKLERLWEHINNQKNDFFHKISTKLVRSCRFIAVEKLNIKSMTSNDKNKHYNHRNILDSSWGRFLSMLKVKAESAGIQYIEVDPKNTSKMCHKCGSIKSMPLNVRMYQCDCGMLIDRDHNAAINILSKGLASVGVDTLVSSMKQEAPSFRVG